MTDKPIPGPVASAQQAAGAPPAGTSAANIPPPVEGVREATVQQHTQNVIQNAPPGLSVHRMDLMQMQELDPGTLDPDRHYRWVNAVHSGGISIARHKRLGYKEELKSGGVRTVATPDDAGDGTIRMGDLILMSCPKTLRQERQQKLHRVNEERLKMNTAMSAEQARKLGVKFIQDERTGVSQ